VAPILEAIDLTKVYEKRRGDDVHALRGLNLVIGSPGAVHGFLGPNGSGKTTAIRCLLGLIRPTSGLARVFGADSTTEFHQVARRVGAIVENPKMFPNFSGRKNLKLLARIQGLPDSAVDRVLETVNLEARDKDTFASYSLGMRQRLAIAGALLKDPDLLILDEPANGLDPAGIAEVRRLIRTISDEGTTVLISSHQLAEIEQVCTEATIIFNGSVVESGSLEDIRAQHGAVSVVVTIDRPNEAVDALSSAGLETERRANGDIRVEIDPTDSARVTRILADNGLYLSALRTEAASLESAFFSLTGAPPPTGLPMSVEPPPGFDPQSGSVLLSSVVEPTGFAPPAAPDGSPPVESNPEDPSLDSPEEGR
jgi:ABC-2 type transport system ATP-binding protein